MQTKIVIQPKYPIQPQHVNTEAVYGFGNATADTMAAWLLRFAKARQKGWQPFKLSEVERFCKDRANDLFYLTLDSLLDNNFIVFSRGQLYFTHRFVATAFLLAPAV